MKRISKTLARPARTPGRTQQTSEELLGSCIAFLQRKFYHGHDRAFSKDRKNLLDWVVLWPAKWLDKRGVTVSDDQYRALFESVFMDALRFGDTGNITYLPAWLAKVIQSHFQHHGDAIYQAAKNVRTLTEHALLMTGKLVQQAPDPVLELAQAARLLKPKNHGKRKPVTEARKAQLDLL